MDNVAGVQCFTEYLGRGQRIGLVPICDNEALCLDHLQLAAQEQADVDLPRRSRSSPTKAAAPVRGAAAAEAIITTEIEELGRMTGSLSAQAAAVLLGDAAHAMTPNIGQGAGMAMEDARCSPRNWRAARKSSMLWESTHERRKPRVETVMRISREVGEDGQRSFALGCWLRDRRVEREGRDEKRRSRSSCGCSLFQDRTMAKISTSQSPPRTLRHRGAVQERARPGGNSRAATASLRARSTSPTGYINLAIVCWKRTRETPNPYPDGLRARPLRSPRR
jgi:hypothetical protein